MHTMTSAKLVSNVALASSLALAGAAPLARAADADNDWLGPKFYVGAGGSFAKIDSAEVSDNDIATGDLDDFDDDHVTWQAFGGAMITPWLGVEAGYLDLPQYDDNGFEVDGHGYTASAIVAVPLGERVELYGKGGRVWWDVEADGPLGFDSSIKGNDWLYGAGLNVGVLPNLSLRLEYARYKLDSDDAEAALDLATAGVQFNF
jgi:opacity protein-like surface antigen